MPPVHHQDAAVKNGARPVRLLLDATLPRCAATPWARGEIVKYVTASFPLQDPGGQGGFPSGK